MFLPLSAVFSLQSSQCFSLVLTLSCWLHSSGHLGDSPRVASRQLIQDSLYILTVPTKQIYREWEKFNAVSYRKLDAQDTRSGLSFGRFGPTGNGSIHAEDSWPRRTCALTLGSRKVKSISRPLCRWSAMVVSDKAPRGRTIFIMRVVMGAASPPVPLPPYPASG